MALGCPLQRHGGNRSSGLVEVAMFQAVRTVEVGFMAGRGREPQTYSVVVENTEGRNRGLRFCAVYELSTGIVRMGRSLSVSAGTDGQVHVDEDDRSELEQVV